MDRDVSSVPPLSPADALPPYAPSSVRFWGQVGIGFVAAAAGLGLIAYALGDSAPSELNYPRLLLVFAGVVTTGSAISMRPDLWWSWGMGAIASVLAVGGLPGEWDSFRLFFTVTTGVAATGAVFCVLPSQWRYGVASALLLFHFSGIFFATTAPPVTPWLTDQLFSRIYNPYLQFVYLRNAYHFYSPEPGPASVMAYLLKTETGTDPVTGKKEYKTQWFVLPKRPDNIRDPLGLGYYRLISLSEHTSRGSPGLVIPTESFEKTEMSRRRHDVQNIIPYHRDDLRLAQYKLPNPEVARYILPSYASHVILFNKDKDEAAKTTVKVYRLEHRDLTPAQLAAGISPYHPTTYRPYFLGEFDAFGNLTNPQEELLYWMIPVEQRTRGPNDKQKDYYDFMSVHALELSRDEVLAADENAGQVFNWSQLR